jgi:hypothetical protein
VWHTHTHTTTTTTPIIHVAWGSAFPHHVRARYRVYTADAIHGADPPLAVLELCYYSGSATVVESDYCGRRQRVVSRGRGGVRA